MERQKVCPECGHPIAMCSDPEQNWYPQRSYCRATAELAAANRRYELLHEQLPFHDGTFENWSKSFSLDTPYRYDDGVTVWVADTDHGLGGDFLQQASPLPADDDEEEGEDR